MLTLIRVEAGIFDSVSELLQSLKIVESSALILYIPWRLRPDIFIFGIELCARWRWTICRLLQFYFLITRSCLEYGMLPARVSHNTNTIWDFLESDLTR